MILSLLRLLEYWLQMQVIRARWLLEHDIEHEIQSMEMAIERARANGDHALADRLRHRLLRSSGIQIPRQPDFAAEVRGDAPGNK